MATIEERSPGHYRITVNCGYDLKGKKIRRTTTFIPETVTAKGHPKTANTIKKEVEAFAAAFENKIRTGNYTNIKKMTFEQYSEKYLEEYAIPSLSPKTLQETKRTVKLFTDDFGYMTLEALNPLFLQEYINNMQKAPKASNNPNTLSYGTIKRRMAVLSAMLSQAVRWNLVQYNAMERVQISKNKSAQPQEKQRYFKQEQAITFLNALDNPLIYQYCRAKTASENTIQITEYQAKHKLQLQLKLFFYLSMFSGCRRGELIALQWSDVDFQNSTISITKSSCRVDGQLITKTTKTSGSIRTIALPQVVMDLAKQWKAEQARYRLLIGSKWAGSNYVFIQWNGLQMGLETPYNAFHRVIDNYNKNRKKNDPELPKIPLHGLRHTSATLLIAKGTDIKTVSERLGHSSTSTTLNIYAHALEELDRTAADTLQNIFFTSAM